MKRNVRVIALIMAILTIVGVLFSLTSLAATTDVAEETKEETKSVLNYTPMNPKVDLYVANANRPSLTRIPDKFTIANSINDIVDYLKEIKRFNPETQYLVLNVRLNDETFFGLDATQPWMGLIKINDKESFYVFTPDTKLFDFASIIDPAKPSVISFEIYEKAEVGENTPFLKTI